MSEPNHLSNGVWLPKSRVSIGRLNGREKYSIWRQNSETVSLSTAQFAAVFNYMDPRYYVNIGPCCYGDFMVRRERKPRGILSIFKKGDLVETLNCADFCILFENRDYLFDVRANKPISLSPNTGATAHIPSSAALANPLLLLAEAAAYCQSQLAP